MGRKPIWEKQNPKETHDELTPEQRAEAKRLARKQGRENPRLVDNINAKKS